MTREEFIREYMGRSQIAGYSVDGERVHWGGGYTCALPCTCEDEECAGWAMIPPSGRGWHLFRNGPDDGRPTAAEALAADRAWMDAERAERAASRA